MKLGKITSFQGNKIVAKVSVNPTNSKLNSANVKVTKTRTGSVPPKDSPEYSIATDLKTAKRLYGKTVSIDDGKKSKNKIKIGKIVDVIGRVNAPYIVIRLFGKGNEIDKQEMIGKFVTDR